MTCFVLVDGDKQVTIFNFTEMTAMVHSSPIWSHANRGNVLFGSLVFQIMESSWEKTVINQGISPYFCEKWNTLCYYTMH